ncbi:MAG: ferritin-like domain-containing protein, partial [Halanaerobium sp.]
YDAVAEILKMKGESPLVKLSEYQEAATIEELDSKKFGVDEVLNVVLADLKEMKRLAEEIRNNADEVGDFEVVGAFEDHVAAYSKNIWFVHSMVD